MGVSGLEKSFCITFFLHHIPFQDPRRPGLMDKGSMPGRYWHPAVIFHLQDLCFGERSCWRPFRQEQEWGSLPRFVAQYPLQSWYLKESCEEDRILHDVAVATSAKPVERRVLVQPGQWYCSRWGYEELGLTFANQIYQASYRVFSPIIPQSREDKQVISQLLRAGNWLWLSGAHC